MPNLRTDFFINDFSDCLIGNGIDTRTIEQSLTPIPLGRDHSGS